MFTMLLNIPCLKLLDTCFHVLAFLDKLQVRSNLTVHFHSPITSTIWSFSFCCSVFRVAERESWDDDIFIFCFTSLERDNHSFPKSSVVISIGLKISLPLNYHSKIRYIIQHIFSIPKNSILKQLDKRESNKQIKIKQTPPIPSLTLFKVCFPCFRFTN